MALAAHGVFGEADISDSDERCSSPEPEDPTYALSGPHLHNEMTLESKWPFSNVFNSSTSTMASTCPYLIETTSDRICFFVRSHPEPQGRFFSLRIDTRGNKHNHVFLFRFLLFSDWTGSKLLTKYYIVHLKLHDTFWLKTNFLDVEVVNHWCEIATKENVTFVMIFKYNIDHDFICHEPGHVKSVSCHLAKKRFKKYPPKRRANLNNNVLPNIVENFGTFPVMQTVREAREEQSKALVRLPPFDTILKKHNIELMGNTVGWLIPAPSPLNLQPSLVSGSRLRKLNGQDLLPIMSELARQLNGSLRNQEFPLVLERQELSRRICCYRERARRESPETNQASPSCSYHISMEKLPVSTSASSQLPEAPNDTEQISEHQDQPQKKSQQIKETLPSCSYRISVEKIPVQTSVSSQFPRAPCDRPQISEHRQRPPNNSLRMKEASCSYHIKVKDLSERISASFQSPGVSYRQKVSQLREQGRAIKEALSSSSYNMREKDLLPGSSVSSQFPGIPYNRQQFSQIRKQAQRKPQRMEACNYQRREEDSTTRTSTTSRQPGVPYARFWTSKRHEIRMRAQRGLQDMNETLPSYHRRPVNPSTSRLPGVPYARQETSGPHELRERPQKEPQEMMEDLPSCSYPVIVEDLSVRSSVSSRLPDVAYNRQETPVRAQSKSEAMAGAFPSSSYHTEAEDLSVQTSTSASYQLPGVPHAKQETSAQRFPDGTATSCWSRSDKASADVTGRSGSILPNISEVPGTPAAVFQVPIPEQSHSQISRIYRVRNPACRRRGRRRIIITCGGERFQVNSKILEDASPVMRAFMNYWTPVPDSNGDIFLEIDGVTTIALENLIKYLSNDPFNHGVMRSSHMKELTRKLKIDINLI